MDSSLSAGSCSMLRFCAAFSSASAWAKVTSSTMGMPSARAFFALPDCVLTSEATRTTEALMTPPTSRPAARARASHTSRGVAIAPVKVTRSPGRSSSFRAEVTKSSTRLRSMLSSPAMLISQRRSCSVTTLSAHACTMSCCRYCSCSILTSSALNPCSAAMPCNLDSSRMSSRPSTIACTRKPMYLSEASSPVRGTCWASSCSHCFSEVR